MIQRLSYSSFKKLEWSIPDVIFSSPDVIKHYFLKGFFDSEGSVDNNSKRISAVSINEVGICQVKDLLYSMGIRANIRKVSKVTGNRRTAYVVRITGRRYIEAYNQKIGFSIKRKQEKLESLIKNYKLSVTPHQDLIKLKGKIENMRNKGLSYQKIANELNIGIATAWRYINKYS